MTAFFVPGVEAGGEHAERAYRTLRREAEAATGNDATARRIFRVRCRRAGRDCEIEVGLPDPERGTTVLAIFDFGRHAPYTVHTDETVAGQPVPPISIGRRVYSVTEFDGAGLTAR